jgi:hypothetical protein
MKNLKNHIKFLKDLKNRHETSLYRYYTRDCQTIILRLILKELQLRPVKNKLPKDIFLLLSNPDRFAQIDIKELCLLYRKIILLNSNP